MSNAQTCAQLIFNSNSEGSRLSWKSGEEWEGLLDELKERMREIDRESLKLLASGSSHLFVILVFGRRKVLLMIPLLGYE